MRPEFWSDEVVASLPDGARLFYIGLWNIADDGGWLEWKPARIGALLYPYESARRRFSNIEGWAKLLAEKTRLEILDCECAVIPTLPRHQRISGKQSFAVRDMHRSKHSVAPNGYQSLSDSPVTERNVEERIGEFKTKVTAAGYVP